jgi:serine/threonine-protein kinase
LFDKIGEGGMARIYLGRAQSELGGERLTVVKQILPLLASSSEFSRLLIEEAKLAAQLSHGNIAQVFDLGRDEGVLYIAMEYVEGLDLRELLKKCSKTKTGLPVEFSLFVACEVLRGLDYAHKRKNDRGEPLGIVHRDVSPSNVLMSFEGEVKLCDFGIARAFGVKDELPAETVHGKAGYMSPEAARGEPVDARSDVFALGVILWELLAGRRLYKKAGPPTLEQAVRAQIDPLPARGYPQEPRLHAIVMKALAGNPADRHASAQAMLRGLEQYIVGAGFSVSPLRFGSWLMDHFGTEFIERRRARERASRALERGPLVELQVAAGTTLSVDGSRPLRPAQLPPPPTADDVDGPVVVPPISPPPPALVASISRRGPAERPKSSDAPLAPGIPLWVPLLVLAITAAVTYWLR